ncbi:MAG: carbon starvation protein A [Victivallales bacterium]|nr:carbon starvation protein A [Victivallales bacterium]
MNGTWLLIGSLAYFAIAYLTYGRFISKLFGVDKGKPCPSHTQADGIDYVPAHPAVLFGHHFASIAGAGPIVGPILAALTGWLPATLWILLGCVFIGAMHDFSAMFLSVRNKGRSIAYAIEKEIGYLGRQVFLIFCFFALILVTAVFTLNVADGFLANPAVATSSLLFIFMAPMFGIATNKKVLTLTEATLVFVPLLFFCVWLGTVIPFDLAAVVGSASTARNIWICGLFYYAFCASIIPVWVLLQPRDYLNSFLLYAMMILGLIGVIAAKPAIAMPAVNVPNGAFPGVFPLLFVTIACGACSGFHSLVASGTSSKQINNEKDMQPVAYGGMLVEGVLAVLSIISVAYLDMNGVKELLTGASKVPAPIAFARGLAHFCQAAGINYNIGYNFISLAISAFMLTSLDTVMRLARFVWQELTMPKDNSDESQAKALAKTENKPSAFRAFIGNRWTATVVVLIAGAYLALSGEGNDMWPVFGASNQLLAALTLLSVTLWLMRKKRPALFAMLPMFFMLVISIWALVCLIIQKWGNATLVSISIMLIILALFLFVLAIFKLSAKKK